MYRYLHTLVLTLVFMSAGAQLTKDPEAGKILDRFSAEGIGDYPVEIGFDYVYESLIEQETHMQTGSVILQDDRFRLRFGESEVYCDGTTLWNHLEGIGEVYISDAANAGGETEFFISSPRALFTFYKEGFKYQLKGEVEKDGKAYHMIYLYPEDPEQRYHTIKLLIGIRDYRLYSAEAIGKHGVNHTVVIREYRPRISTTADTFLFNPAGHPGVEVVDTRF